MRAVSNFSIYQVSNCAYMYTCDYRLFCSSCIFDHGRRYTPLGTCYVSSTLSHQIAAFIFAVALLNLGVKLDHHLVHSYLFPHLNNVNENKNKEKNYKPSHRRKCNSKNTHYKTSWTLRGCKF